MKGQQISFYIGKLHHNMAGVLELGLGIIPGLRGSFVPFLISVI